MTLIHSFSFQQFFKHILKQYRIILLILFSMTLPLMAQPSGGPYGPIGQTYELPPVKGIIYYVAPDGKAEVSGKSLENPTSIEEAIKHVNSGDAIVMRGGIYRTGNLVFNQGITIQPYKDEKPILKGTYVATDWQQQDNGLWVTTWAHLFPKKPESWWRRYRHGAYIPQHRFNDDMVFVDGRFLQSAGWEGELDDNTYYIDYETKKVYLKIDPRGHQVEITAFNVALLRSNSDVNGKKSDGKGPIVRGITFTQYAYRAIEIMGYYPQKVSPESEHGKDVVGSTFENCTISYCSRVAGYFYGDSLTIRHCKVSDTSTEGIYIISSSDVLLEKNILMRNNIEHLNGYYPSAVKIFNQCHRVTCRDNLVTDQENSIGIWYDVGNVDGVFVNNWIENVHYSEKFKRKDDVYPSGSGFYFEISKGAICAGNVFINCDSGIHLRNSSNVQIYQNTLVNSQVLIDRDARTAKGDHFDWHPKTGPGINERLGHVFKNNLLVATANFDKPLLKVWQPALLCGMVETQQLKELDNNVYVHISNDNKTPLFFWSPLKNKECRGYLNTLTDLHKLHPEFAENSLEFNNYEGPLFKSVELSHLHLLPGFDISKAAARLPAEIYRLLKQNENSTAYIGAYPQEN